MATRIGSFYEDAEFVCRLSIAPCQTCAHVRPPSLWTLTQTCANFDPDVRAGPRPLSLWTLTWPGKSGMEVVDWSRRGRRGVVWACIDHGCQSSAFRRNSTFFFFFALRFFINDFPLFWKKKHPKKKKKKKPVVSVMVAGMRFFRFRSRYESTYLVSALVIWHPQPCGGLLCESEPSQD